MKFRAAILVESGAPLVVDEIEAPELGIGQVLVKIHRSGICGAQLNEIAATKGPDKFLPHMLGHEGGGVVMGVGPGTTAVAVGDHVTLHWRKGVGIQAQPAKYSWKGKPVNSGWVTTFSEYSIVSENRCTKIPVGTSFEIAALMGCAITTALGVVNNDAAIKIGQSVLIIGAGGVGLALVQGAAMVSAAQIIAVDIHPAKLEMAKRYGATHTILGGSGDLEKTVREIAGAAGVDVAIENTGNVKLIEAAYRLTANQGRTILVGVPRHDQDITIHSLPLHFGKTLTGCEGGHSNPTLDIPRYLKLHESGKLKLDEYITHRFPLAEVNQALDVVRSGEAGRVVLTMD